MQRLRAFLLGMREFRMNYTTNPGEHLLESYDMGREYAHRLTFRRWD